MKKLLVIGSLNMDFVTHVPHPLAVGETMLAQDLQLVPGAKGPIRPMPWESWAAVRPCWGPWVPTSTGTGFWRICGSVGVEVAAIQREQDAPTGMAVITVLPDGDNSILVLPGANSQVTPEVLEEHSQLLEECEILVLQLEIPLETVVAAAVKAAQLGKQVILDPAPAVPGLPEELLKSLWLIKPNETELSILTGRPYAPEHLQEDAQSLQKRGVKNVLVTLGAAGSYLLKEDGTESFFPADDSVKVVDTTAAGDSYVAALAVALSWGESLEAAARFAARVSDVVVTRPGAQTSIPSPEELEALVDSSHG